MTNQAAEMEVTVRVRNREWIERVHQWLRDHADVLSEADRERFAELWNQATVVSGTPRQEARRLLCELAESDVSLRDRLKNYDHAVDKAHSVGALRMLRNTEASVGRWLVELLYTPHNEES